MDLNQLLQYCAEVSATDLVLTAGAPPHVRLANGLEPVPGAAPLGPEDTKRMAAQVVPPGCSLDREFLADLAGQAAFLPGRVGRTAASLLRLAASRPARRQAALRALGGYLLVAVMRKGGHLGREQGGIS